MERITPCDAQILFVLEGADGTGKTHHTKLLVERLAAQGLTPREFHHKFPATGDPVGDAVEFMEQRRALVATLAKGDVVIADRWFWSTLAEREGIRSDNYARLFSVIGLSHMRDIAMEEATEYAFDEESAYLNTLDLGVVVNRITAKFRIAAVVLDAPDEVLDARLLARREDLPASRVGTRKFYRAARCIDTSRDDAADTLARIATWAIDGIRLGAL